MQVFAQFPVDGPAAKTVLEFLCDGLLDRIDHRGDSRFRFYLLLGGEEVLDHLVLQGEDIQVPDVPGLVGQTGDAVGDLIAVLQDLMCLPIDVTPKMPSPDPVRAWCLKAEEHPVAFVSMKAGVDSVGEIDHLIGSVPIQHVLQVSEELLATGEFRSLFLPSMCGRSFGWLPLSILRMFGSPTDFSHPAFDSEVSFR